MAIEVDRRQVLAFRARALGLDRAARGPAQLPVWDLGVQDSPAGSARLALAARLETLPKTWFDPKAYSLLWSLRGAPHFHRSADLDDLGQALFPLSDTDASARLTSAGPAIEDKGIPAREAVSLAAKAVRKVVTKPTTKGDLSHDVTEQVPDVLSIWCRSCGATHVYDQLLRMAALPAGVRIEPDSSPITFVKIDRRAAIPKQPIGTGAVVDAYLRLLGPATQGDVAGFLGTKPAVIKDVWPAELIDVRVGTRKTWLAEAQVDALRNAEPVSGARLLPHSDPFMQARDRDVVTTTKEHRKALWQILGSPGTVLVDSDVAGTWRAKAAGKGKLAVSVIPFAKVPAKARKAIEAEAERVAAAREAADVQVSFEDRLIPGAVSAEP